MKWNRGRNGLHQLGQPVASSILFPVFKSEGEPGTGPFSFVLTPILLSDRMTVLTYAEMSQKMTVTLTHSFQYRYGLPHQVICKIHY